MPFRIGGARSAPGFSEVTGLGSCWREVLISDSPSEAFGVVYLLGVLVVSTVSGLGLAVVTSVADAIAFDYFRRWPAVLGVTGAQNWVAIAVFLVVVLVANTVAGVVRTRVAEADQRSREVEASRDELVVLAELLSALRRVANRSRWGSIRVRCFRRWQAS
ncbi:DUF4118 domain-containing protein [Rhodococcus sp. NPDC059968]|uniref:DUF4118 domain-containing protein n=1 Tax=Rhodococcus sp. NPDC059968 TaxID=3347017 RepID=UPI003671AC55